MLVTAQNVDAGLMEFLSGQQEHRRYRHGAERECYGLETMPSGTVCETTGNSRRLEPEPPCDAATMAL